MQDHVLLLDIPAANQRIHWALLETVTVTYIATQFETAVKTLPRPASHVSMYSHPWRAKTTQYIVIQFVTVENAQYPCTM